MIKTCNHTEFLGISRMITKLPLFVLLERPLYDFQHFLVKKEFKKMVECYFMS